MEPASDRLVYRRADDNDRQLLRAHWNRPEVRRYLWDDVEVTLEMVAERIVRGRVAGADFGGGLWCMTSDGCFVGTCGLLPVYPGVDALLTGELNGDLLATVGDNPLVEVLYSVEPGFWGFGFAREATAALLALGHGELGLAVVFGGTDLPNDRSVRTLRSVGMRELARFDGDSGPLVYFASTASAGVGTASGRAT